MITNITFGQYYPVDSFLHRLDPRFKIVLTILMVVCMFICKSAASVAFSIIVVFALMMVSKVPLKTFLSNAKPLIPIIILTVILNLIYTTGDPIFSFWKISVTYQGIRTAILVVIRIFSLIIVSSLLTYTTTPTSLTSAIEDLLAWLRYLKVDIHSIAMMMTIALRFIPTLIDEINKIVNAQKARGADFDSGGLIKKTKALVPILIPLFISAFRRAYELANAMECRCYTGGEGRTKLKRFSISYKDFISLFVCIGITIALVLLNSVSIGGLYAQCFS